MIVVFISMLRVLCNLAHEQIDLLHVGQNRWFGEKEPWGASQRESSP